MTAEKQLTDDTTQVNAGDQENIPNLGIARALVGILIIHIVAIAGIFAHSSWSKKEARFGIKPGEDKDPDKIELVVSAPDITNLSQEDQIELTHQVVEAAKNEPGEYDAVINKVRGKWTLQHLQRHEFITPDEDKNKLEVETGWVR